MNQELIQYIQQALTRGEKKEDIIKALRSTGWGNEEIEEVFLFVQTQKVFSAEAQKTNVPLKEENVVVADQIISETLKGKTNKPFWFILGFIIVGILAGVLFFVSRSTSVPLPTETVKNEKNEVSLATTTIENPQNLEATSTATSTVVDEVPVIPVVSAKATSSTVTSEKAKTKTVSKNTVVKEEPTKSTTTSQVSTTTSFSIKNISVPTPSSQWVLTPLPFYDATVLLPRKGMANSTEEDFLGTSYLAFEDIFSQYTFNAEVMETYDGLLADFKEEATSRGIELVSFQGTGLREIVAACIKNESENEKEICGGFGKRYDGRAFVVSCSTDTDTLCNQNNEFYSVVASVSFKVPPFVGVAGADVPKLIDKGKESILPSGVDHGFYIIDSIMGNSLDIIGLPEEYKNGVYPGSPAEKAGLKAGDIMIKVNGSDLNNFDQSFSPFKSGDQVLVGYLRDGKEYSTTLTVADWPNN